MITGRVVRFDGVRGYGFIAPDHGGEDVFLHVNDLRIPEAYVHPGLLVEFEVEEGERGLKAAADRLAAGARQQTAPHPVQLPSHEGRGHAPAVREDAAAQTGTEEALCDVLTAEAYRREVTELLLEAAPGLTARDLLQVRRFLLRSAVSHQWVEE